MGVGLVVVSIAVGLVVVSSEATAQELIGDDDELEVRIAARKLSDGRIEFAAQLRQLDNTWGDRLLPSTRYFPTSTSIDWWLSSSPLTIETGTVRIAARRLISGRTEFALQLGRVDNTWGGHLLPQVRYFPLDAPTGRWLYSSPLTLPLSPVPFTGKVDITVFYCVPDSQRYTDIYINHDIARLNDVVSTFYAKQSSNLVSLEFIYGGIVSPNIEWKGLTIGGLSKLEGKPCLTAIQDLGDYNNLLILVDAAPGGGAAGYASYGKYAVVYTPESFYEWYISAHPWYEEPWYRHVFAPNCPDGGESGNSRLSMDKADCHRYWNLPLVAHEIGHSVFYLDHPQDCSIMYGIGCSPYTFNYGGNITSYIGCGHLKLLGWPEGDRCSIEKTGAPDSQFKSVHAGYGNSTCGIRNDGTIQCWGWGMGETLNMPKGKFIDIAHTRRDSCGLLIDGNIRCWDYGYSMALNKTSFYEPEGQFTSISGSSSNLLGLYCGVSIDNTIVCWNSNGYTLWPLYNYSGGEFMEVSTSDLHTCGLREDGTVECWKKDAISTTFIRDDDRTYEYFFKELNAPEGRFTAVSTGLFYACGIREDSTLVCWGDDKVYYPDGNPTGVLDPPDGRFSAIASSKEAMFSCGLRENGTIVCWGSDLDVYGRSLDLITNVPSGRFTSVSVHGYHACGLRETGKAECWGLTSMRLDGRWNSSN